MAREGSEREHPGSAWAGKHRESEDCKRLSERKRAFETGQDLQDERQAVNTVADLRVSTVRQDAGRQRLAILKHARSEGLSVDAIARSGVTFIAIKENIRFKGERDIQDQGYDHDVRPCSQKSKRDLIFRTRARGLGECQSISQEARAPPNGRLWPGVSRLDGKEHEIRQFLELGVSKTAIAKITGVSPGQPSTIAWPRVA